MGSLYDFKCVACGYHAEISGGDDCGMLASTTTISCEECQELYDIETGKAPWADSSVAKPPKLRCPKRARHHVAKWEAGGPCPRCLAPLERGEETVLWD